MRDDLSLEEQAALTAGQDFWHTVPLQRAGIPSLRVTDGPSGARGDRWSVGSSACVPCGSALAASWDRTLVQRVGRLLADETRAKGAGVLLAPTVNLHRHPITGRHFEAFSEDPYLTAELAVAYIDGLQGKGVGAVVKHLVCNDQEAERHTISVEVDERTLRELYLPPFEAAVRTGVWGVMGAYNKLGGTYCCEHHQLLVDLLRNEWGFDGVVMSDWSATHSTTAVAAGLDLEMPGPAKFLGPHLVDAVRRGEVPQAAVACAAARVLQLIDRTAASNARGTGEAASEVTRVAAQQAIVLLRNAGGVLPLEPSNIRRIAVIGPQADRFAVQGGGSAEVTPAYVSSPLQAIRERCAARGGAEVVHAPGVGSLGPTPLLDSRWLPNNVQVELFDNTELSGSPVARETIMRSLARWGGAPAPGIAVDRYSARLTGDFVADRSGTWQFGLASPGHARLRLDGELLLDCPESSEVDTRFNRGIHESTTEVEIEAGRHYKLEAEVRMRTALLQSGVRIGARPLPPADARQQAVQAAAEADVVLLVVGYDGNWESEGRDRPHMDLPGDQDELVREVLAANPRSIVAVNAGAPISMDWADQAAAILQLWFPGMEGGNALADVLFGDVNPSGRLPTTFPRRLQDSPASGHYPGENGVVRYGEGLLVGYRHYDKHHVEPRFCFGHGLSYTQFEYANLHASRGADGSVSVSVDVSNVGERAGAEVVQVYLWDLGAGADEPDKTLCQFSRVELAAGETRSVSVSVPLRAFEHWDVQTHTWGQAPRQREIHVGASSRDIRLVCALP
jgi:beta-glucosidase